MSDHLSSQLNETKNMNQDISFEEELVQIHSSLRSRTKRESNGGNQTYYRNSKGTSERFDVQYDNTDLSSPSLLLNPRLTARKIVTNAVQQQAKPHSLKTRLPRYSQANKGKPLKLKELEL